MPQFPLAPHTPTTLLLPPCRRVLSAAANMAQAYYLCPTTVTFDRHVEQHIGAYWAVLEAAAAGGGSGSNAREYAELASVLRIYVQATNLAEPSVIGRAQLALAAVQQLSHHFTQAAIRRQLQQLAAGEQAAPALSVEQLHEACALRLLKIAQEAWSAAGGAPRSGAVKALMQAACRAMLQRDAHNFRRIDFVSDPSIFGDRTGAQAVQQLLDGFQLAQRQRSDYWQCRFAALAMVCAAGCRTPLKPALLARAVKTFQHAEPALKRCRRLLPEEWTKFQQARINLAKSLLPSIRARARLGKRTARDQAALDANRESIDQCLGIKERRETCSGCDQEAVGLRACARCRAARYCCRECQVAHWPQHKHECRPA